MEPFRLSLIGEKDRIFFQDNFPKVFEFNADVASAFDDMALRSIPLYREVNESIVSWARMISSSELKIYDLGCSTGTALYALAHSLQTPAHLIGVDASQAMIARAKEKLSAAPKIHHLELECATLQDAKVSDASMVIVNYTLQFVPVAKRGEVLQKIYDGLRPGGILFLSEKTRFDSSEIQAAMNWVYDNFKRKTGYSESEIARKKQALEQVLVSLTLDEQLRMLKGVGFAKLETLLQWNHFVSILCIK